jgi:uncharacterized protein (DUF2267 family)
MESSYFLVSFLLNWDVEHNVEHVAAALQEEIIAGRFDLINSELQHRNIP